jgi:hypothetical protein
MFILSVVQIFEFLISDQNQKILKIYVLNCYKIK